MPSLPDLSLPPSTKLDFGIGVSAVSASPRSRAVVGEPNEPRFSRGSTKGFEVSRISTTEQLKESLGISAEVSYGAAGFGAGISARFDYASSSDVQSTSLFMSVHCKITLPDMSIAEPRLTPEAADLVENQEVFADRYGDMFVRSCTRGGLFVGLIQIETHDEESMTSMAADLKGSYGLLSAEMSMNLKSTAAKHNASLYCSLYAEGGPTFRINDVNDPLELVSYANQWFAAFEADPAANAVPISWGLSPLSIAVGPTPPNVQDILSAQDVITFCGMERSIKLDLLHLYSKFVNEPHRFEFDPPTTLASVQQAFEDIQKDLDLIGDCASFAMTHTAGATMPADYAAANGNKYPAGTAPNPLPHLPKGQASSEMVPMPVFVGVDWVTAKAALQLNGMTSYDLQSEDQILTVIQYAQNRPGTLDDLQVAVVAEEIHPLNQATGQAGIDFINIGRDRPWERGKPFFMAATSKPGLIPDDFHP